MSDYTNMVPQYQGKIPNHNISSQSAVSELKSAFSEEKERLSLGGFSDEDILKTSPDVNGDQSRATQMIDLQDKIKKSQERSILVFGDFFVNVSGVYHIPPPNKDGKDSEPIWLSSPIYPEAYLRDLQGENHSLLLRVFDGEIDHRWPMPRKLIADLPNVTRMLLGLGQEITTAPSKIKLLQQFLMTAKPNKKLRCVDKSGWHAKQYVFPDGNVMGTEEGKGESVYPITEICPEGIGQQGTLEEWQDNVVAICKGNSRMIFSLGVALAGPCAELVNEDSGGFNLKGKSSIGKTKCLKISISIFGSRKYMRSWNTTANALGGMCCLYNDALLPLDEFGQANAKEVGEIAYLISQGAERSRMQSDVSMRKIKTWRVLVLSTGESGLEEHMREKGKSSAKAGQMARFTDIPAEVENGFGCFENIHEEANGSSFADKIDDVCGKYHGTAARSFITYLTENLEESKKDLKFSVDDFVADNAKGCDGQVARVARRFGLTYSALSLAIKSGTLGGDISDEEAKNAILTCYHAWLGDRGTTGDLESKIIIDHVIGTLHEYSDGKFREKYTVTGDEKKTYQQIWGYKNGSVFYIFRESFKNHFCMGKNPTDIAKVLHLHEYLERGDHGYAKKHRIPNHEKTTDRFYTINVDPKNIENGES